MKKKEIKKVILDWFVALEKKQSTEQIKEVDKKGLWSADLKSASFEEISEGIAQALADYYKSKELEPLDEEKLKLFSPFSYLLPIFKKYKVLDGEELFNNIAKAICQKFGSSKVPKKKEIDYFLSIITHADKELANIQARSMEIGYGIAVDDFQKEE